MHFPSTWVVLCVKKNYDRAVALKTLAALIEQSTYKNMGGSCGTIDRVVASGIR